MITNYVVYSNTDYLGILKIQSDYIHKYESKILFINNNPALDLTEIYNKYDKVIFYDNNAPYASRLLECLSQLNMEYILLIHDIDILVYSDEHITSKLNELMIPMNIDRIDLKYTPITKTDSKIFIDDNTFLLKQNDINNYIYNVNPSIWKRTSFIELLSNFKHKGYRDIESLDVQKFCLKYNVYKLHSNTYSKCGYYDCMNFFKFLHISHSGKILALNDECKTVYGQSYIDVKDELKQILTKYLPVI